jgi:hypothetical protein
MRNHESPIESSLKQTFPGTRDQKNGYNFQKRRYKKSNNHSVEFS